MNLSFDNTETAFSGKSDKDLLKAYVLFKLVSSNTLVKVGKVLTQIALKGGVPVKPFIKSTIFHQFCGGETISDCDKTIAALAVYNIRSILDYSVEGKEKEADFDHTALEIISTIEKAKINPNIPFTVFKVTGIARFALLEKVSAHKSLSPEEMEEWARVNQRVGMICKTAYEASVPVFIDAEESWIQDAIDNLAMEMTRLYNKEKAIVYNTLQMYRTGRLAFLKLVHRRAKEEGFLLGLKIVRGAYMEKERERASKMGYPSPIQKDKLSTDKDFDAALLFCIENLDKISICAGTHNEASSTYLVKLLEEFGVKKENPAVYFSQLYGMSDHISFNLAKAGYNVAKYVPYGPVKEVLPYLIRRAEENTSVAGQTSRELNLIAKERKRRKKSGAKQ